MFIGRKDEMEWLKEMHSHSRRKLFPVVMYGPRRVGKTTLVKKFIEGRKALYLFINGTKSSHVLALEAANEIKRAEKKEFLALGNWDEIFKYLIEESGFEILVFDEFQNFSTLEKSVFGTLQNLIDSNEEKKKMLLFLGSSTGMMKDVFEKKNAALYGRMKTKLLLKPLSFWESMEGAGKIWQRSPEEAAGMYFVFGGYPKYISALDDFGVEKKTLDELLQFFFFSGNAPFQNEVQDILRAEFGRKGANYYSIMEAIATGHTKMSEIASFVDSSATGLSAFMEELCEYYELVERNVPILRPKTRDTRYSLKNPLFRFWFRFVRPNLSSMEIGRYDEIFQSVQKDFGTYSGLEFERLAKEYLIRNCGKEALDFMEIGSWWAKGREIDLVTLGKQNCVWECKWSHIKEREAEKIRRNQEENAAFAGIENPCFGLIAKETGEGVAQYFDYTATLGDIFEGKLSYNKRRKA